jgi:hypothetical protein
MFQIGEWVSDLIKCLRNVLKENSNYVVEAIFYDVEMPFERIFCILGLQK